MTSWGKFAAEASELARLGAESFAAVGVAYLATVRPDGAPRAHPVSPVLGSGHLFLFMEPTSPKGRDLRRNGRYAMHSPVDGPVPTVPEFYLTGTGRPVDGDPDLRAVAVQAAGYPVQDRYHLFELDVEAVMCTIYSAEDPFNQPPVRRRWPAPS
jgi:hypothetical protein